MLRLEIETERDRDREIFLDTVYFQAVHNQCMCDIPVGELGGE